MKRAKASSGFWKLSRSTPNTFKKENNKKKLVISIASSTFLLSECSGIEILWEELGWLGGHGRCQQGWLWKNATLSARCTFGWMSDLGHYCIITNQSKLKCIPHAQLGFLGDFTCDRSEGNKPWKRTCCTCLYGCGVKEELTLAEDLPQHHLQSESSSTRWHLLASECWFLRAMLAFACLLMVKKF